MAAEFSSGIIDRKIHDCQSCGRTLRDATVLIEVLEKKLCPQCVEELERILSLGADLKELGR